VLTDEVSELAGVQYYMPGGHAAAYRLFTKLVPAPRMLQEAVLAEWPNDLLARIPHLLLAPALSARCVVRGEPRLKSITVPRCLLDTPEVCRRTASALASISHVRRVSVQSVDLSARKALVRPRQLADCIQASPAVCEVELMSAKFTGESLAAFTAALTSSVSAFKASRLDLPEPANFSYFKALSALLHLDIRLRRAANDVTIMSIAVLTGLHHLAFGSCEHVSNDGVAALAALSSLTCLRLTGSCQVTAAGIAALATLTGLEQLCLDRFWRASDAGLAHLAGLTALQQLNVPGWAKVSDAGLAQLSGLCALRQVNVSSCVVMGSCFEQHAGLTELCELNMTSTAVNNKGMQCISALPALRRLILARCSHISDDDVQHLVSLTRLESLDLGGCCNVGDTACGHIAKLTTLKRLHLGESRVSDDGVGHMVSLMQLKSLTLRACRVHNAACTSIGMLTALESLDIASTRVGDDGVGSLTTLMRLTKLALLHCAVNGNGLAHLTALTGLKQVEHSAFSTRLLHNRPEVLHTDRSLAAWVHLPGGRALTWLDLRFSPMVTDAGLVHVTALRHLKTLRMPRGAGVSDAALALLCQGAPICISSKTAIP
jgi:hypothetical protein